MKISKLIEKLEKIKKTHGDRDVYAGGEDYPSEVSSLSIEDRDNGYTPKGCVKIWTRGY